MKFRLPESIRMTINLHEDLVLEVTVDEGQVVTDCPCKGCTAIRAAMLSHYNFGDLITEPDGLT
jgi:hypothetical protein